MKKKWFLRNKKFCIVLPILHLILLPFDSGADLGGMGADALSPFQRCDPLLLYYFEISIFG